MTLQKRQWLAAQKLPAAAREQIDIALALIDALDIQLAPFDLDLLLSDALGGDRSGAQRHGV